MMTNTEKICKGCTIVSQSRSGTWVKYILGLIDDTRQYENDWKNNDIIKTLTNLEEGFQTWEDLLYTTVRKLKIPKYTLYTLVWDLTNDGTPFLQQKSQSFSKIR